MTHNGIDLFLLMFTLSQVKNVDDIVRLYCEAVSEHYPGLNVRFSRGPGTRLDGLDFPLQKGGKSYGYITMSGKADDLDPADRSLLHNSTGLLASILENREFSRLLSERAENLETNLRRSEKTLRDIGDMVPEIIYIYELRTGRYTYVNKAMETILGVSPDDIQLRGYEYITDILHPDDREAMAAHHGRLFSIEPDMVFELEYRLRDAEGRYHWFLCREISCLLDNQGKTERILGCATDITALKQSEADLMAMNEEKAVLLREVHHRVKNNLAVISSLLMLQEQVSPEPATRKALGESRTRIQAMAIVHEELYKSRNFAEIDLRSYLEKLVMNIAGWCSVPGRHIETELDIRVRILDLPSTVPVALLLNELVTNAFKYAFHEVTEGFLRILFRREDDGSFLLAVHDSGPGLAPGIDPLEPKTLGLQIMNALALQLEGTLRFENRNGLYVSLVFPGATK